MLKYYRNITKLKNLLNRRDRKIRLMYQKYPVPKGQKNLTLYPINAIIHYIKNEILNQNKK